MEGSVHEYRDKKASTVAGSLDGVGKLSVIVGLWLLIAPFVIMTGYSGNSSYYVWNDAIVGGLVVLITLVRVSSAYQYIGLSLFSAFLGAWLVVVTVWSDTQHPESYDLFAKTHNIIAGAVICLLAAWSVTASLKSRDRGNRDIR